MSVGERLREERQRLGLSQERLAGVASVAKNTAINWEKGASSPPASALIAFAEAGADALYILTGRRTADRTKDLAAQIEGRLASIHHDLSNPAGYRRPGESEEAADTRRFVFYVDELNGFLRNDSNALTPDLREKVEELLDLVTNPAALALYRAADYAQRRNMRREIKQRLATLLGGGPYLPNEAVGNLLATFALDYGVPVNLLAELVEGLHDDVNSRNPRHMGKMEPQR